MEVELKDFRVSSFENYREFLKAFYEWKKQSFAGFSYRLFAKKAGFASPNFIQLLIQGKRNLSLEGAQKLSRAMNLSQWESKYFYALVKKDIATNSEESEKTNRDLLVAKKNLKTKLFKDEQGEVLSRWHHLLVRELVFLPDFKPKGEWISEKLRGLITPKQARESIELLLRTGFIGYTKGKWTIQEPILDTGDGFGVLRVLQYHQETFEVWRKLLESLSSQERELRLMNIPMNRKKIPELKKRIRRFQDELVGWLESEEDPDQIVQVGLYVMPTSR